MRVKIINMLDKLTEYEIQSHDTIENLKAQIVKKEYVKICDQELKYGPHVLLNNKTFSDYDIGNGDLIKLFKKINKEESKKNISEIPITIATLDGKTFNIVLNKTDKISDLKYKLEYLTDINPQFQRLILNGKVQEDDIIINTLTITENTVIHMVKRQQGG